MRGTRARHRAGYGEHGIIPAYAGNTSAVSRSSWQAGDHPRVCGEHIYAVPHLPQALGSSPRMRGTHHNRYVIHAASGIIPAYAGNTHCFPVFSHVRWDHPRVCGEHA